MLVHALKTFAWAMLGAAMMFLAFFLCAVALKAHMPVTAAVSLAIEALGAVTLVSAPFLAEI